MRLRSHRGILTLLGLIGASFLLSACGSIGGIRPIFPTPVSPNGQAIYDLYIWISIPAIIIFVGVEGALLWVAIRYRRKRQPVNYVAPQVHGNTRLEVVWTVIPLIIVLAIAAASFVTLQNYFQPINNQQMLVVVRGHQFGWTYTYENGVVVDQEGELATPVTPFVVPTDTLIKLQFEGTDVIHSWWVPAITGKTDAVPGYANYSWMNIHTAGTYRGECAELCGVGHATMQIIVEAVPKYQFDNWMATEVAKMHASPSPGGSGQSSPSPTSPVPAGASPNSSPSAKPSP